MDTRRLLILSILVAAFARADVPDVTASLEYVSNPAKHRWPSDSYERGALDLQFHRGTLLVGSGEVENNRGPVHIYGTDPVTLDENFEYSAGTEALATFRLASWGEILAPSQDPREGDANQAHVFIRGTNSVWRKHSSIGGNVPWNNGSKTGSTIAATHVWDMEEFDGRVFSASYQLHWSTNRCVKFVDTGSITNAYRVLYYMTSASGGTGRWSLRRQMQLLRFANDLYAVPNTLIQPNNRVEDTDKWYNKAEVFHWNPSTLKFDESRQAMSTLFPNISSNDFRLVLSSSGGSRWDPLPTGTYDKLLVRLWHTTPFKGRVLYVGCYDTQMGDPALTSYPLPLMGCSATLQTSGWGANTTKTIKATRLSFDGDTEEYPWDFVVVGDTCYALTSKPNASTKVVRHSVWKSTNGTSFERVFSFDFHQNMISLDYRDGWFWFGVGVKNATRGYAYNNTADEAGAIYRVRLPQEPTSVEAVDPPATVAEGSSSTISFHLTAQPSSNLTLRVAARERRGISLDKTSLTFTTSNWSTPQTVTVSLANDDITDQSPIVVQCGAFGDDIQRGEFCSPQVTSAPVILSPVENDPPPAVASESVDVGPTTAAYRVTLDSFGAVNLVPATSASVSVHVYTNAALTALAGEASGTINETGVERTFTVSGLSRGVRHWLVAEIEAAPGVVHSFKTDFLTPIANPEDLVDLMDDAENRELSISDANTGGANGQGAYDNTNTKFGGYSGSPWFIYQFKTPVIVDALGVCSSGESNPDRNPSTIKLYGANTTNKNDFVLLFSRTGETDWTAGEWRRWLVDNETAYTCYKFVMSGGDQHCYVREVELYGTVEGNGRIRPTDPTTFGSLSYDTESVGGATVRVYHDLAYGTRGDAEGEGAEYTAHSWGYHNHRSGNYFDVYADDALLSSASARAKMPVFVFLHGGSWSQSYDKDGSSRDLLKRVAAAGYFVVTMDYQLQSDITELGETTPRENATFADMLADVDTMMTYLKTALPAIGLPTDKIVIGGESAGAHLAMCYAWDQSGTGLSGASLNHDLNVACVMSAVGPANLADEAMLGPILAAASIPDPAVQAYVAGFLTLMGWLTGTDIPAMVAGNDLAGAAATMSAWSPLGLVNGESCHAILAYGCTNATVSAYASDGVVPVSNYSSLTNALTAAAVSHDAQLFMLPAGMNHGNISWNYEPSVAWIVEKLVAFKEANFNEVEPVSNILIADSFSAANYTAGATLKSSTGGDTTGFSTARPWSAKTVTGALYANDDGQVFPASWSSVRYPSGGYAAGFKSSSASTASDTRGACRQLADGAFPTSGTIYYRILLRHATGAAHCPTNCYRAAGFLPQDFTALGDQYAEKQGTNLFNKGLWLGTRGKGGGASSINLRLGSQDLVLVETMQEDVTYLCVARMDINADGSNERATGFAMPVDDYTAPVWSETVLTANVLGADAPLAWFGIVGGYKTNNKYVSFDELVVSTVLADVVPVPEPAVLTLPVFRSAEQGGGMLFSGSGASRSLTFYLEGTLASAYYAVFTNGTLQGPFFAAADGVTGANSGILVLPVDAKEPSKFFAIGVSDTQIHEGDELAL